MTGGDNRFWWCVSLALAVVILLLSLVASGEGIQRWRTKEGKVYFGANPPPGSEPAGNVGSLGRVSEPPTTMDGATRARHGIEVAINAAAARLNAVRTERDIVRNTIVSGSRDRLPSAGFVADAVNYQADKKEDLERLRKDERTVLREIQALWQEFGAVKAAVMQANVGSLPEWWRGELKCERCPSLAEVNAALAAEE